MGFLIVGMAIPPELDVQGCGTGLAACLPSVAECRNLLIGSIHHSQGKCITAVCNPPIRLPGGDATW
jgi:hypothetical protein